MWLWLITAGCATVAGDAPPVPEPGEATVSVPSDWPDDDRDGFDSLADCDDGDGSSYPGGIEYCDGRDNDCDGVVDERPVNPRWYYADADGDGYGVGEAVPACEAPEGYGGGEGDCDDSDPSAYAGAPETCLTGYDADCDGEVQAVCEVAEHQTFSVTGVAGALEADADLDGDGRTDILVGEWRRCPGRVVVLPGEAVAVGGQLSVDDASWQVIDDRGCDAYGWLGGGYDVGTFSDLDADGLPDIAFESPYSADGFARLNVVPSGAIVVVGEALVSEVASLALLSGSTTIVNIDLALTDFWDEGASSPVVWWPGSDGTDYRVLDSVELSRATGEHAAEEFAVASIDTTSPGGCPPASLGPGADFDADGLTDLVAAYESASTCPLALGFRSGGGVQRTAEIAMSESDHHVGAEWASPGILFLSWSDVDNDGTPDLLAANMEWPTDRSRRGRVLMFSGAEVVGGSPVEPVFVIEGPGEGFGWFARMVRGDEPRLLVTAYEGESLVFDAAPLVLGGTATHDDALYGFEGLTGAEVGDFDGDGLDELVVESGGIFVLDQLW